MGTDHTEIKKIIGEEFEHKLGRKPNSLSISNEMFEWRNHSVVSIDGVDVLLSQSYIMDKFRNYNEFWGTDQDRVLADVIVRAYQVAVGDPDTNAKDLPVGTPIKGIHIYENLLVGIKIRQEVVDDQLKLFPEQKDYFTYTLKGEAQIVTKL